VARQIQTWNSCRRRLSTVRVAFQATTSREKPSTTVAKHEGSGDADQGHIEVRVIMSFEWLDETVALA